MTEILEAENHLVVYVDNSVNTKVYPQKADFTFYGGIYRDVELLTVSRVHFALDYFAGPGIKATPEVKGCDAGKSSCLTEDGKKMDPTRVTTLACYAMCIHWNKVAHISDIVAWNLYLGWYVPGLFLNDWWIKLWRLLYPKRCLGFSEYGAEGMPNLHGAKPRRGDNTEEYQNKYHEFMLECFKRHPYMWGNYVWNTFSNLNCQWKLSIIWK